MNRARLACTPAQHDQLVVCVPRHEIARVVIRLEVRIRAPVLMTAAAVRSQQLGDALATRIARELFDQSLF